MLGRPTVEVITPDGRTDLRIRRTDGVQMLINLAVNPHGATSDELMALLWPEIRPHYARCRFHTTMSELRQRLDESVHAETIPRTGERYHLDPHHVDVDLWRLNSAIDRAATALDPAAHEIALRKIINLYPGSLAEGRKLAVAGPAPRAHPPAHPRRLHRASPPPHPTRGPRSSTSRMRSATTRTTKTSTDAP